MGVSSLSSVIVINCFESNELSVLSFVSVFPSQADHEAGVVPPSPTEETSAIPITIFILFSVPWRRNYVSSYRSCFTSYLVLNFMPLILRWLSKPPNESPRVEIALLNKSMVTLYSSPGPTYARANKLTVIKIWWQMQVIVVLQHWS